MADRALPVGNKICAARVHKRYEETRAQRLREMKPQIDARAPRSSGMKHLKINYKRDEQLNVRYDEIERDNRHLLHSMSKMIQDSNGMSESRSMPSLGAASGGSGEKFPGGPARKNEIARIEFENARMLKRLQGAHAEYKTKEWEAAHDKSRAIMRRVCQYPVPNMSLKRRVRSSASLMPMMAEDDMGQGGMDPSAVAPEFTSSPNQSLQYVLKEERMIGGINFFIEMATDGQTLAVSAFDKEIEDTLELLVNEDNHRQLLFECDGDYAEISARLNIRDDRLVIMPAAAANNGQE